MRDVCVISWSSPPWPPGRRRGGGRWGGGGPASATVLRRRAAAAAPLPGTTRRGNGTAPGPCPRGGGGAEGHVGVTNRRVGAAGLGRLYQTQKYMHARAAMSMRVGVLVPARPALWCNAPAWAWPDDCKQPWIHNAEANAGPAPHRGVTSQTADKLQTATATANSRGCRCLKERGRARPAG